jgi:hypothetical protein
VPLCYKRTSSFAAGGSGMSVCLRPRLKTVATETHTADCAYLLAIRGHSNRLQNRLHLSRNGPSSSLRWRSTVYRRRVAPRVRCRLPATGEGRFFTALAEIGVDDNADAVDCSLRIRDGKANM